MTHLIVGLLILIVLLLYIGLSLDVKLDRKIDLLREEAVHHWRDVYEEKSILLEGSD